MLGSVAPGFLTPEIMRSCIAPAAARLHSAVLRQPRRWDVVQIGKPVPNPACSILIPLYRNLGFLRFQLAALAEDPECRRSEIVLVLDSPEQRAEAEHLLRGLHLATSCSLVLVIMPRNLGYAAANNTGALLARGRILLLLNSDVVPSAPGWLTILTDALSRRSVGAAGPKLLFDDGSIQHAGLFFERDADGIWFNRHYHKGFPRDWPDASVPRRVPGLTGACVAIRRDLFQRLGGICEDFIIGDYEDLGSLRFVSAPQAYSRSMFPRPSSIILSAARSDFMKATSVPTRRSTIACFITIDGITPSPRITKSTNVSRFQNRRR